MHHLVQIFFFTPSNQKMLNKIASLKDTKEEKTDTTQEKKQPA